MTADESPRQREKSIEVEGDEKALAPELPQSGRRGIGDLARAHKDRDERGAGTLTELLHRAGRISELHGRGEDDQRRPNRRGVIRIRSLGVGARHGVTRIGQYHGEYPAERGRGAHDQDGGDAVVMPFVHSTPRGPAGRGEEGRDYEAVQRAEPSDVGESGRKPASWAVAL